LGRNHHGRFRHRRVTSQGTAIVQLCAWN
jgi:hypothetical protein